MANASKALLPLYMFIGDDNLKREALLTRMKQRFAEMGDIDLNLSTFEGPEIEPPDAVAAACNTMPFLSEKRLVVVRDIGNAKKAVLDSLAEYMASPMETTVLVLTGDKISKSSRLYKDAMKEFPKSYIACDSKKKRSDVVDLACKMMGTFGVNMDPSTAAHLVDLVGTSTIALDAEVRKLRDYVASQGRGYVDARDVDAIVTKRLKSEPWKIADAMSRRDAAECLRLLAESPDDTPYAMMTMCERRIRELIVAKSLRERPGGRSFNGSAGNSMVDVFGGPEWKYRNHDRFAANFTEDELIEALDQAAECELRMKTGTDTDIAFPLWLTGVCTGRYPS